MGTTSISKTMQHLFVKGANLHIQAKKFFVFIFEIFKKWRFQQNTGCSKSLGHILMLNVSKTIKEITMHLIYSESLQSQVFYRMFKDVQCEHH